MRLLKPLFDEELHLTELPQTIPLKLSHAVRITDKSIRRSHEWCKCRDFLGDVIYANTYKERSFGLYHFNASRAPLDEFGILVLKTPSKDIKENIINNYTTIINEIEAEYGIPLTRITLHRGFIKVEFDTWWRRNIPLFSFYTFLIKVCCYKYLNPANWVYELRTRYPHSTEAMYVWHVDHFRIFIKKLPHIFEDDLGITGWAAEEAAASYAIHDSSGFFSLFRYEVNNGYSKRWKEILHECT